MGCRSPRFEQAVAGACGRGSVCPIASRWIPAFAGMTRLRGGHKPSFPRRHRVRVFVSFLHSFPVAPSALHGLLVFPLPCRLRLHALLWPRRGGGRSVECQSSQYFRGTLPSARRGGFGRPVRTGSRGQELALVSLSACFSAFSPSVQLPTRPRCSRTKTAASGLRTLFCTIPGIMRSDPIGDRS